MIHHYFKIAFRSFAKDKVYSLINLTGLALAVACSFLIALWVQYENNYESAHVNRKQIYRVLTVEEVGGERVKRTTAPAPLGQALKEEFPMIVNSTFLNVPYFRDILVYNMQPFSAIRGEANRHFFEVFTYEFLHGSPETAFDGERPIVISEDFAKKVFGASEDIIGQPLYDRYLLWGTPDIGNRSPYIITAVVRIPKNTHVRFDILVDAEKTTVHSGVRSWRGREYYTTFVQIAPNAVFDNDTRTLLANYLTKHLPDDKRLLMFQPLTDIHLNPEEESNLSGEFGEPRYIYIFLTMAIFVLLIAVINYVNLSIARSANRSREAGLRKASGATRSQLIFQFLSEAMLWAFVAMLLAVGVANIIMPWFSEIMGAGLTIEYSLRTLLTALVLALFTGLLAGGYSAFYLSSFPPMLSIKGGTLTGSKSTLRRTLLGVQLAISVFIMLCTGIVYGQLHYIQTKDVGFDRFNVIGIHTGLWYGISDFKQEVLRNANVEAVSIAAYSPIDRTWGTTLEWEGKTDETLISGHVIWADWDYAKVFRLQMVEGNFLPENLGWAERNHRVINETAAKIVGMDNIIGKEVDRGRVTGVIKDFNFRTFHEKIAPLIIQHNPETSEKVFIRISPHNQRETLNYIKGLLEQFKTDSPFEYFFMDDEYNKLYQKEFRLGRIFLYFSLLSIFISCMGVFCLVAFMVAQRSKEIAIRKINGATAIDIIALFAREFSTLTLVAFAVASPFALYAMHRWLQTYQYRIDISVWYFVAALAIIWLLAMLSLIVQVYRAARRNPVESLKRE